ncbi:GGDEF domain-containing phosphodiesterase [Bowmanella dokdonensis]|nr:bifunctional diguanylate cyclase/phosphodiesterase [Bowmanella dokdonensis]
MNKLFLRIQQYLLVGKSHFSDNDDRTWKLSVLRLVLLSGTLLTLIIVLHSSYIAYSMNMHFVLVLTLGFSVMLWGTLMLGRKRVNQAALALISIIVLAGTAILLFVPDFGAAKYGLLFLFTLPLLVRLFFGNKAAIAAMLFNLLPYALLIRNQPLDSIFNISISLPQTHTYLSSLVFLFFNFCLPLAVMRLLSTIESQSRTIRNHSQKLNNLLNRYQEIFDNGGTVSLFCDEHGRILQANKAARHLIRQSGRDCHFLHQLFHFDKPLLAGIRLRGTLRSDPSQHYELQPASLAHHKTQLIHCHNTSDMEALDRKLAASRRQHFIDPLTGLRNHNFWYERAYTRLKQSKSLILLKLANLREVNIQYGLNTGDQLLSELASRLKHALPANVHLYRFPGAKFLLAVPDSYVSEQNIQHWLLNQLPDRHIIEQKGGPLTLAADWRAGCTRLRARVRANLLVEECSIALSQTDARQSFVLYNSDYSRSIQRSSLLRERIKRHLDEQDFVIWLQPQYNDHDQRIGFEALARINQHEGASVLLPHQFLPQIAENDWHVAFSSQILHKAIRLLENWPQPMPMVPVAINLAGPELLDDGFYEKLLRYYSEHPLLRRHLELEITETSVLASHEETRKRLTSLANIGATIIIDDFGTGHASLSQLIDISATTLKIDREFVGSLGVSERHLKIVQSALELAGNLNLHAIAEGVETRQQLQILKDLGCTRFQGYLFGKPMPLAHWCKAYDPEFDLEALR